MTNPIVAKLTPSITDIIRSDHTKVVALYHQYKGDLSPTKKKALAESLGVLLLVHATAEEEVFYQKMRQYDASFIDHSYDEQQQLKQAIEKLRAMDSSLPGYDEALHDIMKAVFHHVAEEETVLLPKAEQMLDKNTLSEMGASMYKRHIQLMGDYVKPVERARNYIQDHPLQSAVVAGAIVAVAGRYWHNHQNRNGLGYAGEAN